jgi:hypothetical protein
MSGRSSGPAYLSTARLPSGGGGGVSLTGLTGSKLLQTSVAGTALASADLSTFVSASSGVNTVDDAKGGVSLALDSAYTPTFAGLTVASADAAAGRLWTCTDVSGAGQWAPAPTVTAAALSKADDTNVTLTLSGSPGTALLQAATITAGWTGQLGVTRGGTGLSTIAVGQLLYGSGSNTYTALPGNTTAAKQFLSSTGTGAAAQAPVWGALAAADIPSAALTKTDDTNVTLTLGGSASSALVNAASLTLGWTGQLGVTRGGTGLSAIEVGQLLYGSGPNTYTALPGNTVASRLFLVSVGTGAAAQAPAWSALSGSDITGAALTKTDDTNVTLTLGGSASSALLNAASLTLGWTGQLGVTRGGTGLATVASGALLFGSALNTVSGLTVGAADTVLVSNGSLPSWSASPQLTSLGLGTTAGTAGQLRMTGAILADVLRATDIAGNRLLTVSTTANSDLLIGRGLMVPGTGQNVIIGNGAAPGNTGIRCVIIGSGPCAADKVTGNDCVIIGAQDCGRRVQGNDNIVIGRSQCIASNLTGSQNMLFGTNCGRNLQGAASNNMAIGANAIENCTTGSLNVGIGWDAGKGASSNLGNLSGNTWIGAQAGRRFVTGTGQVCIGYQSGYNLSGGNNTLLGYQAGYANGGSGTSQNNNTMLGFQAGYSNIAGSGNVFLGYMAGFAETGSNMLYISNSSTATPLIRGNFAAPSVTITGSLTCTSNLFVGTYSTSTPFYSTATYSSVTWSFGTNTATADVRVVRIGRVVTISLAPFIITPTGTQTSRITCPVGTLAAEFRPVGFLTQIACLVLVNGSHQDGRVLIMNDGQIVIARPGFDTGDGTFTNSSYYTGLSQWVSSPFTYMLP